MHDCPRIPSIRKSKTDVDLLFENTAERADDDSVMEKFADLRWVPAEPELLDYPNAQFLMIGEAQDNLGKGGISEAGGKEPNQEQPGEVLEKFEDENLGRIESLKGESSKPLQVIATKQVH